jgi:PucR family transcriptional regulator, purine catabolism regulatory protein
MKHPPSLFLSVLDNKRFKRSFFHTTGRIVLLLAHLPPHSFQYYETLLLPRVLLGDQEARQGFLDALFGRLKSQRNGAIRMETLLTWARSGFHGTAATQKLSIHPKTLQYRLARAAELAELDLADADVRFRLQLAAYLVALPEKQ